MAIMRKRSYEKQFVQILNDTARAVEEKDNPNPISLEALGLLVNLWSYNVESWDLHKTELYKRFAKNKKTSVTSAWDELVQTNYIFEVKVRNGRKWDFIYYYRPEPFSELEIKEIEAEIVEEYGLSSTSDFQQLKFNSTNSTVQNPQIIKNETKKDKSTKEKPIKNKTFVNKENQVDRENSFKDELINIADNHYSEFASSRWSKDQWFTITNKLTDEIIEKGTKVTNPSSYIYSALKGIAYKHDLKKGRIDFESRLSRGEVPFYNWLEDTEYDE
jgi:hypothetical protein